MKEKIVYLDYLERKYERKIDYILKDPNLKSISDSEAVDYYETLNCECITLYCKNYPKELKMLPKPPLVIYYIGNIKLLGNRKISIIGSRNNTLYGKKALEKITLNIKGYTTVSGFAVGIDQIAHIESIKNNLSTIAILGGGFEHIYPKNNAKLFEYIKENELVLTEYPPSTSPKPWHFLMRNRLIAALSEKIVVIEASVKSGSLTTVEIALEMSKDVYALPGSIFSKQSKGCNLLIEEGANILSIDTEFIV